MFPPVPLLAKRATQTTVFNVTAADPLSGETKEMVVPAGSMVFMHIAGIHYNGTGVFWVRKCENPEVCIQRDIGPIHILLNLIGSLGSIIRMHSSHSAQELGKSV